MNVKTKRGFTLIELMIVVAIIGILAAIAIPKFAQLITKSNEANTKGNLGAMRSALSIYYRDMEGWYPTDSTLNALTNSPQCDDRGEIKTIQTMQKVNSRLNGKIVPLPFCFIFPQHIVRSYITTNTSCIVDNMLKAFNISKTQV